jgi:hypothetical protein
MSEIKNSNQMVQDAKKPHLYDGNDSNLKNVASQITNITNIQRQILKKLDEENSIHSKLEKTLLGIKNDLKEIKSCQNDTVKFKKDLESLKLIKTKISEMQSQLGEIKNDITTINLHNQTSKSKEEKRKNKELKKEEKRKNKELKRDNNKNRGKKNNKISNA